MPSGFLFSIGSNDRSNPIASVEDCFRSGQYATLLNRNWTAATTATMGDFVNMKPGDNVYLFANRLVYGIGEIIPTANEEAAGELYPGASSRYVEVPEELMAIDGDRRKCYRWAVRFKPSPFFFRDGVDMDDLLCSNPDAFHSLRTFWKRSFIQLDDTENSAFKSAIIRHNEHALSPSCQSCHFSYSKPNPDEVMDILNRAPILPIDPSTLLRESRKSDGSLSSEMALEVGVLHGLRHHNSAICNALGFWDYVSHQVAASPFKPIDYMDRIDVFGYRWIKGYEGEIVSKYLVVELKKGPATLKDSAPNRDYNQLMKYVDWVCEKYAHGDYSMIEAVLVAHSFDFTDAHEMRDAIVRPYVTGHQAQAHTWENMRFVSYDVSNEGKLSLKLV